MIRVGINGLGRIGRNCFRHIQDDPNIQIVHINDPNLSLKNLCYLLKYDSIYGRNKSVITVEDNTLLLENKKISTSFLNKSHEVNWQKYNIDVLIESSGVVSVQNDSAKLARDRIVKKTIITHTFKNADKTVILGVNDINLKKDEDHVISSSICDSTAVAPIFQAIKNVCKINSGSVITLHPWLQYQNLMDGPCRSFAHPHQNIENFSLGRASTEALIPKTTSCIDAVIEVHPDLRDKIYGMSFRVPTPSVSCAIINVLIENEISHLALQEEFKKINEDFKMNLISINDEELISRDFIKEDCSAIIDDRWTLIENKNLRIVAWYDNEHGYCSRVIDIVKKVVEPNDK
tara:strand:- start:4 stop:1044 length:1041 start_codon:yes stop_codon:yes gene_type:complete